MALGSLFFLFLAVIGTVTFFPRVKGDGFVAYPIKHVQRTRALPLPTRFVDARLFNVTALSYLVDLNIGTPAQSVRVAIDTGSDELWVNPNCQDQNLTDDQSQECVSDGSYRSDASSTASRQNVSARSNRIQYGLGNVRIQYVSDTIKLPDSNATVVGVQFGVATGSQDLNEGILGLGFGAGKNTGYSNFVDVLAAQGVTGSKAFSVALGNVEADNGGIVIFGGIDTKKFSGRLQTNDMLPPQSARDIYRYYIQLDSVGLVRSGSSKTYAGGPTAVVLDTGSSLSYLPRATFEGMSADFGARLDSISQLYLVPCSERDRGGTLEFVFAGGSLQVPVRDFIWEVDEHECVFGALPTADSSRTTALLGDTFMRSVYAVFDQTAGTISLAPYTNCGEEQQSIPPGGVANLTGTCEGTTSSGRKSTGQPRGTACLIATLLASAVMMA